MKLAVMQPYFMPYIGYFQLMNAVDKFVLYDNVQFIKDGWINRNRILVNNKDKVFTIPLKKDSHTTPINGRYISEDRWVKERRKLIIQIEQNYRKTPFFEDSYPVVLDCLMNESLNLFEFIRYSIQRIQCYLKIDCDLLTASKLDINHQMKGQDKILSICQNLQAATYVNAIGGLDLYDKNNFRRQGIELYFIKSTEIVYPQFNNEFVPRLSIIDIMMFNSVPTIREFINSYELI